MVKPAYQILVEIDPEDEYPKVKHLKHETRVYIWEGHNDYLAIKPDHQIWIYISKGAIAYYGFYQLLAALEVAQRIAIEQHAKHVRFPSHSYYPWPFPEDRVE